MSEALTWLFTLEILGIIGFLLGFPILHRLPDRGYSVAKALALILLGYLVWMSGLTQLVPYSPPTIIAIIVLGAILASWLALRHRETLRSFLKSEFPALITTEVIFLGLFIFWLGIVALVPAINHTEKPMDFAFLNAIFRADHFPPEDPWLVGHSISYYYFGHLMMATLSKVTATAPAVGYNIALATIPALTGAAAFGLLYNLIRLSDGTQRAALGFALTAPILVMLAGNLEGVLELAHQRGWGDPAFWQWVGVKGLEGGSSPGSGFFPNDTWWWWRSTRVIDTLSGGQSLDYTITEFPFFSFVLGDLHPHMMSLPFLLLFLSLVLNLFVSTQGLGLHWLRARPWELGLLTLTLGSLAFINVWDLPTYASLAGAALFLKAYRDAWRTSGGETVSKSGDPLALAARSTAVIWLPVTLLAGVLFLPFYLDLSSQAGGILPYTGPGTRPFLLMLVIGLPLFLSVTFLIRQCGRHFRLGPKDGPALLLVLLVSFFPLLLWMVLVASLSVVKTAPSPDLGLVISRVVWVFFGSGLVALGGFSALQRAKLGENPAVVFPLILPALALYLIVGAEMYFLLDLFGNRMNTVFKVYYQAWVLLAIGGAYAIYYWHAHPLPRKLGGTPLKYAWTGLVLALLALSMYLPVGAILERTGFFRESRPSAAPTLDGLAFLQETDPDEYAAIDWLRDQDARGGLVEAVGGDYSSYGRISSSTGIPTLLGWQGHEIQWRGSNRLLEGREAAVKNIYESDDPNLVAQLLEKYAIQYVYWGQREQRNHVLNRLDQHTQFLKTTFQQGSVTIYEFVPDH